MCLLEPISNTLKRPKPINLFGDMSFGEMAWLTPGGVLSLDRNPAAFLSSCGRQNRRSPAAERELLRGFVSETVPVLSSDEDTNSILESLQQFFEEFAVRIMYARDVLQALTASF